MYLIVHTNLIYIYLIIKAVSNLIKNKLKLVSNLPECTNW